MPDDEVFDLDALDREANSKPFVFRFDGREYTCPDDISIEMIQLIEAEDVLGAMRVLLGDEQWDEIVNSPKMFGVTRMGKVLEAYRKHLGIGLPNSSASTTSSRTTARR